MATTVDEQGVQILRHQVVRGVAGQCHASTVCAVPDGLLVAWFQGDHEGAANSEIWLSRGMGDLWSTPVVVSAGLSPCWNPVLHVQLNGRLLLYFKVGQAISSWQTHVVHSDDAGSTWSEPRVLVVGDRGGRGPVRTPPVRLASGRLLAGASTEQWGVRPRWDAFVDISDDDGLTWRRSSNLSLDRDAMSGPGVIQPTLWQSDDGTVHLLGRSGAGYLIASSSSDDGETWSSGEPSSVPNNNSGISACAAGGRVFLAHNPVSGDWATRAPLVVSVSDDDGLTWQPWATLEESIAQQLSHGGEAAPPRYAPADTGVLTTGDNEFSYPTLIPTHDGLAVTYTWQRRGISLAVLDPSRRRPS
jgi:predicted neuraminidase